MQICENPLPFLELRSTNQVGTTRLSVHLCCFTDQNPVHIPRYSPLLHRQPSNFVTFSPITPHPRLIFPLGYLHLLGELCYYSARGIEQEITMGGLNADYFSNFFLLSTLYSSQPTTMGRFVEYSVVGRRLPT
jgi:hypothetical protein